MAMRIVITGSRSWNDQPTIRVALAAVWHPCAGLVSELGRAARIRCASPAGRTGAARWSGTPPTGDRAAFRAGPLVFAVTKP